MRSYSGRRTEMAFRGSETLRTRVDADLYRSMKPPSMIEPEPELSAPQQLGLMILLRTRLSKAIVDYLKSNSTARVSRNDFDALSALGYTEREPNGYHHLTWKGLVRAQRIENELQAKFSIAQPRLPRSRKLFGQRDGMSSNGNA